jgi:hypothetical protein
VALARPQTGEASAPQAPTPEVERQPSAAAPAVVPRADPTPMPVPPTAHGRRAARRARALAPETDPDTRPEPWQGKAAWLRDRFRSGGEMQRSGESSEMEQPQLAREEPPGDPTQLRIEVLVWAADPGRRMVYLNGRKYVEGDTIEKGTVIEQIVQDGIVLLHQGQRVRVPSGAR